MKRMNKFMCFEDSIWHPVRHRRGCNEGREPPGAGEANVQDAFRRQQEAEVPSRVRDQRKRIPRGESASTLHLVRRRCVHSLSLSCYKLSPLSSHFYLLPLPLPSPYSRILTHCESSLTE